MNLDSFMGQVAKRLAQAQAPGTMVPDSCRLFHGRGKTFPGLEWCNVDYFHPVVIVVFYQSPGDALEAQIRDAVLGCVAQAAEKSAAQAISQVLVQRRYESGAPFETWLGDSAAETLNNVQAKRGDLRFNLSFSQQNVGYFLDIERARCWLEHNVQQINALRHSQASAQQASVLNLFSYTCAFSVVAKSAGAQRVVNIDMSRRSLNTGRENHRASGVGVEDVHFFAHDIFKSWGKLKKLGPYDVVVIDPPSFQKGSFIAEKDYAKVLRKMAALVAPEGYFLACLNAPEIHETEFKQWVETSAEGFEYVESLASHPDFPEAEEGHGLKLLVYKSKGNA